mmetsp:Transcript_18543/g.60491  ORF Transcript_18543/g.60491 Transcript_18543/m.60491 type:complete len:223 (-) Transcript_18543:1031-1699(-)
MDSSCATGQSRAHMLSRRTRRASATGPPRSDSSPQTTRTAAPSPRGQTSSLRPGTPRCPGWAQGCRRHRRLRACHLLRQGCRRRPGCRRRRACRRRQGCRRRQACRRQACRRWACRRACRPSRSPARPSAAACPRSQPAGCTIRCTGRRTCRRGAARHASASCWTCTPPQTARAPGSSPRGSRGKARRSGRPCAAGPLTWRARGPPARRTRRTPRRSAARAR